MPMDVYTFTNIQGYQLCVAQFQIMCNNIFICTFLHISKTARDTATQRYNANHGEIYQLLLQVLQYFIRSDVTAEGQGGTPLTLMVLMYVVLYVFCHIILNPFNPDCLAGSARIP